METTRVFKLWNSHGSCEMMVKKESIENILKRHDLEEAVLILRQQLDKEEEIENEMRKLNPNYEPLKPPAHLQKENTPTKRQQSSGKTSS